jgi:predicted aminopeptidase
MGCYTHGMGNRYIVRLLSIGAIILMSLGLGSCWYVRQAGFFVAERLQAVPAEQILADPSTTPDVRAFLSRVDDVRRYAHEELGLSTTEGFTTYVPTEKDHVAYVISACAADSFERYLWWYPVLGPMPYRGFYEREDADFIHARLRRQGYDVVIRKVEAFSSLGFFKDPLYSFMVSYEEGELADLIIHESAHATLFIRNDNQFNEELATFVGRSGAERYLSERYGVDSEELAAYQKQRNDSGIFSGFLLESARRLEAVYSRNDLDRESILEIKQRILAERKAEYALLASTELSDSMYAHFEMALVNNAYLDLYRLYEEDLSLYQQYFDTVAGGNLREFVARLMELTMKARRDGLDMKDSMAEEIALGNS